MLQFPLKLEAYKNEFWTTEADRMGTSANASKISLDILHAFSLLSLPGHTQKN